MNFRFWRNRKTRLIVIVVVAVAALAAITIVRQSRKPAVARLSTRPTSASLDELISEADADFQRGKVAQAVNKYRLAREIDATSPELKSKLSRAEERLPDEPQKDGDKTSPPGWRPADLNDPQATPASILPPEMAGYKITQSGWLKAPTVAGATYVPLSPSVAKQIDRVFLTVGKFDGPGGAKELLNREYQMFSVKRRGSRVNDHAATFGLYNEPRPHIFPILASLSWTRGKWFFSVQAAPLINRKNGTQPSEKFKRGVILDVADKLGY